MSTFVTNQPCSTSSLANFVAWGQTISNYLGAMYSATVTVSGSGLTVTATSWTTGSAFPTDGSWTGATILIGGAPYPVASVTSGSVLTLSSPATNGAGQTLTAGWIQSGDVGQVVWTATTWTGITLTAVGSTVTVTWTSYAGPLPRVGMTVTFSGFANSGNNAIFTLKTVSMASKQMTFTNAAVNLPDANNGSGAGTTVAIGGTLTGTCNTSGTTVTWVSGNDFPGAGALTSGTITIGGTGYTISSIGSPTTLTTTGTISTGGGSGVTFSFTYAYPGGTSNYAQEVWGLADSLQSTNPFYIHLWYGTGTTASDPALLVQVTTQPTINLSAPYNGQNSGALEFCNVSVQTFIGSNAAVGNSATSYECDFSGNVDRFGCILWRNSTGSLSRILAIDRSKNSSGANTGNYITILTCGTGANSTQQSLFSTSVATFTWGASTQEAGSEYRWATLMPVTATTGVVNGNTLVSPVWPLVGQIDNQSLAVVCGFSADWAEGATITPTFYGNTHTYLYTKSTGIVGVINQGNNAGGTGFPAIRWE